MTWRSSENQVGVLQPVAGAVAQQQLVNGKLGKWVTARIEADVAITVAAATAIRNRGNAAALIDRFFLVENGENRWEVPGKALQLASEANAPSALGNTPLAAVAVGNYHISQTVRMFFRTPMQGRPDETAFIERDQRQGLFFSVRPVADLAGALVTKGGATVAVTNLKVYVTQEWHEPDQSTVAPLFIPTARVIDMTVVGGGLQQPMYLRAQNNIRAMVISQEGDGNEVNDVINTLRLVGDTRSIIGPNEMPWADLLAQSEFLYGGRVRPSNDSHLYLGFLEDGLLSNTLNPRQDTNLRILINGQPSAGAALTKVWATLFELEHTPGITSPVPFPY